MEDVENAITRQEPNSAEVLLSTARLFSRIACRQARALQLCVGLLQRSVSLSRNSCEALCELGYVYLLQGDHEMAMKSYREASKRDASSTDSLEGMIWCQISAGELEDAEAQIELLNLMHKPEEMSPEFSFLRSIIAKKDMKLSCLEECRKAFFARYESHLRMFVKPWEELLLMNPEFLLQVGDIDTLPFLFC